MISDCLEHLAQRAESGRARVSIWLTTSAAASTLSPQLGEHLHLLSDVGVGAAGVRILPHFELLRQLLAAGVEPDRVAPGGMSIDRRRVRRLAAQPSGPTCTSGAYSGLVRSRTSRRRLVAQVPVDAIQPRGLRAPSASERPGSAVQNRHRDVAGRRRLAGSS